MKIGKLIPFESFIITSLLSEKELQRRLLNNVKTNNSLFNSTIGGNESKTYEGMVDENSFKITRIISYKNAFQPVIKGEIVGYDSFTNITITMRPTIAGLAYMAVWLGGTSFLGFFFAAASLLDATAIKGNSPAVGFILPWCTFALGWLILLGGFKPEAKKSKQFLARLFEAT